MSERTTYKHIHIYNLKTMTAPFLLSPSRSYRAFIEVKNDSFEWAALIVAFEVCTPRSIEAGIMF